MKSFCSNPKNIMNKGNSQNCGIYLAHQQCGFAKVVKSTTDVINQNIYFSFLFLNLINGKYNNESNKTIKDSNAEYVPHKNKKGE